MRQWRQLLLGSYLHSTMPYRLFVNGRRARRGLAPVMVLFYHRVADDHPNPWTMSDDQFSRQILWLHQRFDLVSLEEAQRRIRCGNARAAVSITFDDGYADNCHYALPFLVKHQIPCTYFVAAKNVFEGEPFPHDVQRGQPLLPNSLEQLRALSGSSIEVAAHTRTHADLGAVSDTDQLFDEVIVATRDLEAALDRPIRYFAFPFGMHANLNQTAFHLAKEHGLEAVCSAYGGYNFPGDDPFHLQRIHADPKFVRLKNWLTVDPRKVNTRRFDYGLPCPNALHLQAQG
ncbi:MAG: polysaccharide deacetylase family protein [Planctomycetes bacterium]|nr:polysaccharide deacetylase family protein [Planctomycetota bacterium]